MVDRYLAGHRIPPRQMAQDLLATHGFPFSVLVLGPCSKLIIDLIVRFFIVSVTV